MSMTVTSGNALVPTTFEGAVRFAEMMARAKMVPSHLQGSPGDCLLIVEQAGRWGMSPFAVAQCTSVIQGRLMFEGKLVAAALHTSGALATRLDYQYSGEGASRAIRVLATLTGETAPRFVDVRLADAKTNNGMWTKQPDQQLAYHGARVWARRYAPEVMLGVYAPEEMEPVVVAAPYVGVTIDAVEPPAALSDNPRRTLGGFIAELEVSLRAAPDYASVLALVEHPDTRRALDAAKNGQSQRLADMIDAATARFAPAGGEEGPGDGWPGPAIGAAA